MMLSLSAVRGNRHFLEQGIFLLNRLSADDYATPVRSGWAAVGSQYRHILDHYRSFLLGWREGCINYDARLRDRRMETDPAEAARVARSVLEALEDIHVEDGDRPVLVQMDCGGNDGVPDWRPSTVGRELQFLVSHTVHHYALIRLMLEVRGISTNADFGNAPSTLAWHQPGAPADGPAGNPTGAVGVAAVISRPRRRPTTEHTR